MTVSPSLLCWLRFRRLKSVAEDGIHGQFECITYEMGLHVPYRIHPPIQMQGYVWGIVNLFQLKLEI